MNCSNCQIMKKDVPCIPAGNDFKIDYNTIVVNKTLTNNSY